MPNLRELSICSFKLHTVFLSICVSVSNITQNIMNGLWWSFMEGSGVVKGTRDYTLVVIQITSQPL